MRQRAVALVGPRPDSHGGVGATVRTIAQSALAERYRLIVVPTYRDGPRLAKALQAAWGLAILVWLAVGRQVALVHLHSSWGSSFTRKALALAVVRAGRLPVVLHVHGGAFRHELRRSGWRGAFRRRVIRWALERADVVVALTPGWAEELGSWARIRRLRVIPNAPDLAAPVVRNGSAPRTVLYLGHLYRDKGIFELVDAFARLRAERPGLRLVLAGEGSEGEALRAHVTARGLDGDAVELPGWVGPEAKGRLLASAACLALPSYHEGLPLVLLEAMAAGVPVVATAVGGVPEVARDGQEALLVPPREPEALADALARVLDEPELAARLAEAGQRRALAEYAPEALARRVGAVYDDLLEEMRA